MPFVSEREYYLMSKKIEGLTDKDKEAKIYLEALVDLRRELKANEFEHNYLRIKIIDDAISRAQKIRMNYFETRTNVIGINRRQSML